MEEEQVIIPGLKVYARPNDKGFVEQVFSSWQQPVEDTDIFIKEGYGDEFVHVTYYKLFDEQFCHNYKIVDNQMVECTYEDKQLELSKRETVPSKEELLNTEINELKAQMLNLAISSL